MLFDEKVLEPIMQWSDVYIAKKRSKFKNARISPDFGSQCYVPLTVTQAVDCNYLKWPI